MAKCRATGRKSSLQSTLTTKKSSSWVGSCPPQPARRPLRVQPPRKGPSLRSSIFGAAASSRRTPGITTQLSFRAQRGTFPPPPNPYAIALLPGGGLIAPPLLAARSPVPTVDLPVRYCTGLSPVPNTENYCRLNVQRQRRRPEAAWFQNPAKRRFDQAHASFDRAPRSKRRVAV